MPAPRKLYEPEPPPPPILPPNWRPRFTIRWILGLTTICCALFAVWHGLLRGAEADLAARLETRFWVVALVTLPMLLMVALSLLGPARRLWKRLRRRP